MSSLSEIFGQYLSDYEDLIHDIEADTNTRKIYKGLNSKNKRPCILKIISKKQLLLGDYDFLNQQINREEEINKICKSENIIEFYRRLDTKDNIIFELEYCESDLKSYFLSKESLAKDLFFFKKIVISIAKALKVIHQKGAMHRDIKPDNIFIKSLDDNKEIKLGDFGCSIFIKDNISDPIGSILYAAPEILKNMEYDEKCDLWSLGITLYQLYFGVLPYGYEPNTNIIMDMIYDEENFRLKKTNIPTLDILFHKLLTINPKDRMEFDEFFKFVFKENFMKKDYIDNNYIKLYQEISKQEDFEYEIKEKPEFFIPSEIDKENAKKIITYVKGGHLPDIMDFSNGQVNDEQKFNNIIYYDENIKRLREINRDSDFFERNTPGAFILCTDLNSLKLIKNEIVTQIKQKDSRCTFNLVTTGSTCDKIMDFLKENEDFKECITHSCVYCLKYKKWSHLKEKYEIVHDVYTKKQDVVNYIKEFSSKKIKTFPITKVITYEDYIKKYKDRHITISQFYGDLTPETYEKNIKEMESLVKQEEDAHELKKNSKKVLTGFYTFDIKKDIEELDKLIIKEYTKNTFYGDLNKWLMNFTMNSYETVAYFTARLMYSLNSYGKSNNAFYTNNEEVKRGIKIPYSCLLPYQRAKGKVILLSGFTSTSQLESKAEIFSGRKNTDSQYKTKLYFSVIYHITNNYKENWISNGVDIKDLSTIKSEKEVLYQPFSFYYVKDVKINLEKYTADIDLCTIGKVEILEEKIKDGKNIEYNKEEEIMQVKN